MTHPLSMSIKLSHINPGTPVRILHVSDSYLKPKLLEMGLISGSVIDVLFKAPLGDPIAIDIKGYILSLRLDEAATIEVELVNVEMS